MGDSNFLKNSIFTFTRNIVVVFLGIITTVLIARVLGPEKQGMYALIILLPTMLMTFLNLGIGSATVFYLGRQKYSLRTILSTNVILAIIFSCFSALVGSGIILLFGEYFFSGISVPLLFSFLSTLPILFLNSFNQSVFQGIEDFKVFNLITVIGKVVNLGTLILFIYLLPFDLLGALIAFVLGHLTTLILILYIFIKRNYRLKVSDFSFAYVIDGLKYGLKAHFSNILSFLNYRVDILLISFFIGPSAVGIYNVAVQIAERLWIISQPVSAVLFPRISSSTKDEQDDLTATVARNVLFLSIVAGIVFYVLSDKVIYVLFGIEYIEATVVIKILLPGITVFAFERILSNSLAGKGKPELNLYTSMFTVVCNISLNVVFIPIYGLNGAAFATSTTYFLSTIIKLIIYVRFTKCKITSLIIMGKSDFAIYKAVINKVIKKR